MKTATDHLQVSLYDEENQGNSELLTGTKSLGSSKIIEQVKKLVGRKIDAHDFDDQMKNKTNKIDHQMSLNNIHTLHKQLESTI